MSNPAFDDWYNEQGGDRQESNPMKELRNHAKELEKQLKATEKEKAELLKFREEVETRQRRDALASTFTDLGLTDKQAELYFKTQTDESAEIKPEDIKLWAIDYGLLQAPETDEEEVSSDPSFVPIPKSAGGPPSGRMITSAEFDELMQTDQAQAIKLASEGRVQFETAL